MTPCDRGLRLRTRPLPHGLHKAVREGSNASPEQVRLGGLGVQQQKAPNTEKEALDRPTSSRRGWPLTPTQISPLAFLSGSLRGVRAKASYGHGTLGGSVWMGTADPSPYQCLCVPFWVQAFFLARWIQHECGPWLGSF